MDKMGTVLIAAGIVLGAFLLLPRRASASEVNETVNTQEFNDFVPSANAPRGIRNNNPGNIRYTSIKWNGQIGSDGTYAIFDSAISGIRAMVINIHTGFVRDGENTVRKIITEWAPSTENDTRSYINAVAQFVGAAPDAPLDFRLYIKPLVRAIIRHENGYDPYPDSIINAALEASGKVL